MSDENPSGETAIPKLVLFVTGTAPRSLRARANLERLLEKNQCVDIHPYEVDLLEQPEESIKHSVFATPALMKVSQNGEVSVLYGDLSEEDCLQRFLSDLGV